MARLAHPELMRQVYVDVDRLRADNMSVLQNWEEHQQVVARSKTQKMSVNTYGIDVSCTCAASEGGLPVCLCSIDRSKPPGILTHTQCHQNRCQLCMLMSDKAPDLGFYQRQPWMDDLRIQVRCGNIPRWAAALRCYDSFPDLAAHQQPTVSSLGPVGAVKDITLERLMSHCPEKSCLFNDIPIILESSSKTFVYATLLDVIKQMKETYTGNGSRRVIANCVNRWLLSVWDDLAPRHRLGVHWIYPLNSKHIQQIDGRDRRGSLARGRALQAANPMLGSRAFGHRSAPSLGIVPEQPTTPADIERDVCDVLLMMQSIHSDDE